MLWIRKRIRIFKQDPDTNPENSFRIRAAPVPKWIRNINSFLSKKYSRKKIVSLHNEQPVQGRNKGKIYVKNILEKVHVGSETNWKLRSGSRKNHSGSTTKGVYPLISLRVRITEMKWRFSRVFQARAGGSGPAPVWRPDGGVEAGGAGRPRDVRRVRGDALQQALGLRQVRLRRLHRLLSDADERGGGGRRHRGRLSQGQGPLQLALLY